MGPSKARRKVPRRAIVYGIVFGLIVLIILSAVTTVLNELARNGGGTGLAPDFTLDDLEGNIVTLSQLRGRPVLLDFMNTTSSDCKKDMPTLVRLNGNYSQKGIVILSITLGGETAPEMKKYLQAYGASWSGLLGTNPIKKDYDVKVLPTYFMVDSNGAMKATLPGSQSYDSLEDLIESSLS